MAIRRADETGPLAPKDLQRLRETVEPMPDVEHADLSPLLDRIGDSRIVLLGEASHGTSEFYRFRARLTMRLVREKGFNIIGLEADWPDAARIDHYVRGLDVPRAEWTAFARFPTWMWRNQEMRDFVDTLHRRNAGRPAEERAAVRGLDLYSMYTSLEAVIRYLEKTDIEAADFARERYACLSPFEGDPTAYGHAASFDPYNRCEDDVVAVLQELVEDRRPVMGVDGERYLDAVQNARLVRNAEQYYRAMYRGGRETWNMRDSHMFETLAALLEECGPDAKAVVWAHNSHLGDARATEMSRRGEHNLGQLCREAWGDDVYSIGFGTHTGTVAAADRWDGSVRIKKVAPSLPESHERACHDTGIGAFMLPLRGGVGHELFADHRLERAIGVIYRPDTERHSHYFDARLSHQFDEYVWIDETEAVMPLVAAEIQDVPETYPFGV